MGNRYSYAYWLTYNLNYVNYYDYYAMRKSITEPRSPTKLSPYSQQNNKRLEIKVLKCQRTGRRSKDRPHSMDRWHFTVLPTDLRILDLRKSEPTVAQPRYFGRSITGIKRSRWTEATRPLWHCIHSAVDVRLVINYLLGREHVDLVVRYGKYRFPARHSKFPLRPVHSTVYFVKSHFQIR